MALVRVHFWKGLKALLTQETELSVERLRYKCNGGLIHEQFAFRTKPLEAFQSPADSSKR